MNAAIQVPWQRLRAASSLCALGDCELTWGPFLFDAELIQVKPQISGAPAIDVFVRFAIVLTCLLLLNECCNSSIISMLNSKDFK